jgi:hypothetical protein
MKQFRIFGIMEDRTHAGKIIIPSLLIQIPSLLIRDMTYYFRSAGALFEYHMGGCHEMIGCHVGYK